MTGVTVHVAPGVGEMFEYPAATLNGKYKIVFFFFAIPGGPLEAVVDAKFCRRSSKVPQHGCFPATELFFPDAYAQIDLERFGAARAPKTSCKGL